MKLGYLIFIFLFTTGVVFAQYETDDVTGDFELAANWTNAPSATVLSSGSLTTSSFNFYGDITRNGDITQGTNVVIYGNLTVDGDYSATGGSLTVKAGQKLIITGDFNSNINIIIEKGAFLGVYGNFNSTGGTVTIKGSGTDDGAFVIGGDFYTSSNITINNNGNLIVGGDFTDVNGTVSINGSDNTDQIYFLDPDATISTPMWGSEICDPGTWPDYITTCEYGDVDDFYENEDADLIDFIEEIVLGGGTCSVVAVVTATPTEICFGETIQLNATGGTTYTWSDPAEYLPELSATDIANPIFSPTVNPSSGIAPDIQDEITFTVTASDGTCSEVGTIDVVVRRKPESGEVFHLSNSWAN